MKCAWKEFLAILPPWLRPEVDRLGKERGEELRLRLNTPPELRQGGESIWLEGKIRQEDLHHCINTASRFSPWSGAGLEKGYVTAPGGHRIGICGDAVMKNGQFCGVRSVQSVCIRIARDFPGIAGDLAELCGSVLILGAPGWGKTTLLRDLIRQRSARGQQMAVVDQRGELFPQGLDRGRSTDVLTGCPKDVGMDLMIRTMGPDTIALDEITAAEDCSALISAAWCGVELIATVHATSVKDLRRRKACAPLLQEHIFQTFIVLRQDKSWYVERSGL